MLWRGLLVVLLLTRAALAQEIVGAAYDEPTTRYPHAVLGDDIEYGALILTFEGGETRRFRLPETRVFEDTAPRPADLSGDGRPEVIVVESHARQGARLAAYGPDGLMAATDWIGTRFRWLAPVGVADLDGDGRPEAAYVDRPHLAKTLRIVRMEGDRLVEIAALPGVTNHRIGEPDIAGGIRECGQGPEMILADAGWRVLLAVTLNEGVLETREIGPHEGRDSFAKALAC